MPRAWCLVRDGCLVLENLAPGNDPLAGDLIEQYRAGRSAVWYWREVLTAIGVTVLRDFRTDTLLTIRGLVIAVTVFYLIRIPSAEIENDLNRLLTGQVPGWFLKYRGDELWRLPLWFASYAVIGWYVALFNRRQWVSTLLAFLAYLALIEFPMGFNWNATSRLDFAVNLVIGLTMLTVAIVGTLLGGIGFRQCGRSRSGTRRS